MSTSTRHVLAAGAALAIALGAANVARADAIDAKSGNAKAAFDIVKTEVRSADNWVEFRMRVSERAGSTRPTPIGKVAGSEVFAYVWPTSLDSAQVGFEAGQGILAFAATAHPDFDDTPLFDENGDGNLENDGNVWHSHWVVLVKDDACGQGALKVKDIPEGTKPQLPKTWPGLPILIDSPGYSPSMGGEEVVIRVPFEDLGAVKGASYDGVTAGLRVNANLHAPFLCVVDVMDVASGNLSLPGAIK